VGAVDLMLDTLDLFSGLGAFTIGLEATGGFRTVAFCERNDYCRRVLASRYPAVPIYDDVRSLTATRLHADGIRPRVICGGFPCQDVSWAGSGLGLAGERSGLWGDYARLVGELGPEYVLVENVAALRRRGLAQVLGDLSDLGYDAEWDTVSACAVGAPHMRRRLFIVAYPNGKHGWQGLWNTSPRPDWQIQAIDGFARARAGWAARLENPSELYRGADGVPFGPERNHAIGNAIVSQIPELLGRAILAAEASR
jgi:DNA (cytosine-5)-methyltransferase 1